MPPELGLRIGTQRSRLLRYARQRLGNPSHAEDAVQDTMVAALECMGTYAGEAALETWLHGILRHKIVDSVRRTSRERAEPLPEPDALAGAAPDPEEITHGCRILERLERHLAELPARAAQVFMLRDVLGMNAAEACRALGITPGNCGVLLHRARRRLRERLAGERIGVRA